MNKIPNRKAICDTLMEAAKEDKDIVVLCSDPRPAFSAPEAMNGLRWMQRIPIPM